MKRKSLRALGLFTLLVALGVGSRLVKEICPALPPNFHAIVGTTLLAGFLLPSRKLAAAVPLVSMLLSDWVIGGYDMPVMLTVYASLVAPIVWRGWLERRLNVVRLAAATLASSLLFFATTNLAVWLVWYPHTFAALVRCYVSAIPFLRYAVLGDLLFAGGLFAIYALVVRAQAAKTDSAQIDSDLATAAA